MKYDPEANLISWEITKGNINNVKEFGNLIVHLSKTGKPILIEMLDATKFVGQIDNIKKIIDIKKQIMETN